MLSERFCVARKAGEHLVSYPLLSLLELHVKSCMALAHPKAARSNQHHLIAHRTFDSTSTAPIGFCAALPAFMIIVIQPYLWRPSLPAGRDTY